MPTKKITDNLLRKAERPTSGVLRYWDTEIKGFSANVQKRVTTFYYERDNQRQMIGRYPTVSVPQARETARELDYKLRRGVAKHVVRSDPRLRELMEAYLERPSLRSEAWKRFVRQAIEKDLGWADRKVSTISPALCREVHRKLRARGPVMANNIVRVVGTVWNHGRRLYPSLPEAPTYGIEPYPEPRTLNAPITDLAAWKQAVDQIENPIHQTAYMLALFTGLRRSEIAQLEWSRIDDAIFLPAHLNKSGRDFWLPLVDQHRRILEPMRGIHERWVFLGSRNGDHIKDWRHTEVPGTLHSLRHTFATVGVEAGLPEEVVGRLLNHASQSVTGQRYVRPNLEFLRTSIQVVVTELDKRLIRQIAA
jgi:integrase